MYYLDSPTDYRTIDYGGPFNLKTENGNFPNGLYRHFWNIDKRWVITTRKNCTVICKIYTCI